MPMLGLLASLYTTGHIDRGILLAETIYGDEAAVFSGLWQCLYLPMQGHRLGTSVPTPYYMEAYNATNIYYILQVRKA